MRIACLPDEVGATLVAMRCSTSGLIALLSCAALLGVSACSQDDEKDDASQGGAGGSSSSGSGGGGNATGGGNGSGSASTGGGGPVGGLPLLDRVSTTTVTTPAGVMEGVQVWRVWGRGHLNVAPVFTAPLASCGTLVCYTTGTEDSPNARVAVVDAEGALTESFDLGAGLECRGLAAEPDGHFGALLWDDAADRIWVKRYDASGAMVSESELVNDDNTPNEFGIGDSRLEYGGGKYGAYYHVHSDSGHEGDSLKYVDAASGDVENGWDWGCSHSMSTVLRYNPTDDAFMPACVTDCYPGTSGDFATQSKGGIYLENDDDQKVLDVDGGCNGSVAAELGSAAIAPSGYKLVFNAHQNPFSLGQDSYDEDTMNQDIGFVSVSPDFESSAVVWLTTTDANEADSSIARFEPSGDATEQYLVGWLESGKHLLSRVSADGAILEGPVDVSAVARWGRRDDPFRTAADKDVTWAWFDEPGSTELHVARVESGQSACTP